MTMSGQGKRCETLCCKECVSIPVDVHTILSVATAIVWELAGSTLLMLFVSWWENRPY